LIEKSEVQKALYVVYDKALRRGKKPKREDPSPPWAIIGEVIFQCTRLGVHRKGEFEEIYQSKDEAKKLAKDIRRIKNRTTRLLALRFESGDSYLYHFANRTYEKDPFVKESYPDAVSDEQVMKSLDILSGAYDYWNEYLLKDRRWGAGATGIEFRYPKGKGKRKDLWEYSFVHSLKRVFVENIGDPLSPVIAILRNAVFTEKKPIDARRVREMLEDIEQDPDCISTQEKGLFA